MLTMNMENIFSIDWCEKKFLWNYVLHFFDVLLLKCNVNVFVKIQQNNFHGICFSKHCPRNHYVKSKKMLIMDFINVVLLYSLIFISLRNCIHSNIFSLFLTNNFLISTFNEGFIVNQLTSY